MALSMAMCQLLGLTFALQPKLCVRARPKNRID